MIQDFYTATETTRLIVPKWVNENTMRQHSDQKRENDITLVKLIKKQIMKSNYEKSDYCKEISSSVVIGDVTQIKR